MGTPANTRHYAGGLLFLSLAVFHVVLSLLLPCHAKPDGLLCIPSEREALLRFKRDLTDPSNRLSSWAEDDIRTDCCRWSGVVCHNSTGNVLQLRLACTVSSPSTDSWCDGEKVLGGKLNPSLLNLKHLTHLDLSWNDFQGVPIPTFLGSLQKLRYLNLSHGGFGGTIPRQLTKLSSLQSLDLNYGYVLNSGSTLEWAAGLSSLQFLGLSWVNLSRAHDWLQVTNRLPCLQQLHLSSCQPPHIQTSLLPAVNFPSLSVLDFSFNSLSLVPGWIFTLPALTSLSLSYNNLQAPIPAGLGNLTALTSLDLSYNQLDSTLPKWLFDLDRLEHLNLRGNSFRGRISESIGNMTSLTTLDFSHNQLRGEIPEGIGDMTSLTTLDVSYNAGLRGGGSLFEWLGNLCRLKRVGLSGIKFGRKTFIKYVKSSRGCITHGLAELSVSGAQLSCHFDLLDHFAPFKKLTHLDLSNNSLHGPIPESIGRLSSLKTLYLSNNQLTGPIPESIGRLSSLQKLGLSYNQLAGSIPKSIGRLSSLKTVDLSDNQLDGPIPEAIGRLPSLEILYLSNNKLAGHIPESIGALLSLQVLFLGHNQLNGTLPKSLGQLINLESLDTSYNPMTGVVTEIHFANLTKLTYVSALENRFNFKVRPNWVPPFQLTYLRLDSWQLGPQFPPWLQSQICITQLQMSRAEIKNTIPNWFWNSFSQLLYLNLSQSQIHGSLNESLLILSGAKVIDLSSNLFSGVLPLISSDLLLLNLSNNYFSGSISPFMCPKPHDSKSLTYLNLQNNHLSGELPDCWMNWMSLTTVRFGNNKFTGNIPSSIGFLYELKSLHFQKNHLQGELPTSMGNFDQLLSTDLGENNFVGSLPAWIGKQLALLKILRLRSNKFDGKISNQICALTSLQVLDLAHNNFYGNIPTCFNKFKAMTTTLKNATIPIFVPSQGYLPEDALLVWKGISLEYNKILGLVTSIDLSSNNLSGEIPRDLMTLVGLRSINLSYNFLSGKIPEAIGDMKILDSIDFSHNQISGMIPLSMSTLTFLCYLDLSNNKLVGRIPLSTQLQSFDPSSYAGNKLCGPPVSNNCSTMPEVKSGQCKEDDDHIEVYMSYGSMTIGFIMGFWIIWGPLLFMKSWRLAYFKSLESLCQKIYDIGSTCS